MAHLTGYVPDPREFAAAAGRLTATAGEDGGTEPAAVTWLITFAQADALSFPPSVVDTTLWEALRFSADGGQGGADYGQSGGLAFRPPAALEDKRNELRTLQDVLREAVAKYLSVGVASFPKDEAGFTIARGYRSVLFSGRSLAAGFYYMAGQLLARYGHRVKHCEGCPKIMLVGRKDQRFHSKTCQIGTFVRKTRAKEKAERLAQAQRKKVKGKNRKTARTIKKGERAHGTKR
jgi:hypothetical protein